MGALDSFKQGAKILHSVSLIIMYRVVPLLLPSRRSVKALFCSTIPDIWKTTALLGGSLASPALLLERIACSWRWVWRIGVKLLTGEAEGLGLKPVPVPLSQPRISHGEARHRIRSSAARRHRLTARARARSFQYENYPKLYARKIQFVPRCKHIPFALRKSVS